MVGNVGGLLRTSGSASASSDRGFGSACGPVHLAGTRDLTTVGRLKYQ